MLLAIDIGNSNIVAGIYKNDNLLSTFRINTDKNKSSKEYAALFSDLLETDGISLNGLDSSIISCVVPQLNDVFSETLTKYFNTEPLMVSSGIKTGMPILYDNPEEVGADRIVNSVAAYQKYKKSLIVVDFGTATTFDCISEEGEYTGRNYFTWHYDLFQCTFYRGVKTAQSRVNQTKKSYWKKYC